MENKEKYKVTQISKKIDVDEFISYFETRYIIVDSDGVVVDDAQGHGYKTQNSAYKAMWYRFGGGKKKMENDEKIYKKFEKKHKAFLKEFYKRLEYNFKEIARKETTPAEIMEELEIEFKTSIPEDIKKILLK